MLKASNSANPNSTVVIAFKPRQVLLAEHRTKSISMSKKKQSKTQTLTLTEEHKTCLLHSVIKYLEKNALSKTLKRIISEAQIQNEEWKTASLDLEELYCKSLDTCNQDETTANTIRKEELQTEGTTKDVISSDCAVSKELIKKNKKKKSKGEKSAAADQSEAIDKKIADSTKNSDELSEVNVLIESAKTKGKKKSKNSTDYSNDSEQVHSLASKEQVENTVSDENGKLTDKVKDKKKKSKSNNADQEEIVLKNVVVEELSKDSASAACDIEKEKKSSKKRKRLVSDENENLSDGNEASEESERRETKGSEKSKKNKSKIIVESKESEKENSQVANIDSTKTSKKQPGEHDNGDLDNTNKVANGYLEKSEDKSAYQKSTKKQRTGSAEPKTVNAFQRVKIDEVEFADEKLQDNSYWAKDGAEIGYGAKAQEVLGQVRGRDFRHEKTKKKRGSYRGGLIDLQSHSVKFSYSDED